MTYLLLQTFLLLLSSYFLGAFIACILKRSMLAGREPVAMPATASAHEPAYAPINVQPVAPRSVDPVQPKIDILPRPEPRPAPAQADTSRFDRALVGSEPPAPVQVKPAFAEAVPVAASGFLAAVLAANAKMPRKSIVEIRPKVLKPVTPMPAKPVVKAEPQPVKAAAPAPAPVAPKPVVQPAQSAPAPQAPVQAPVQAPAAQTSAAPAGVTSGVAGATAAAAAAAVAAAKAAAAASTARPQTAAPQPAPTPSPVAAKPVEAPRPAPAPQPAPPAAPAVISGDDFLRIRAIDEDIDGRLKALGVRSFDQIARWTAADINRVNQALGFTDRIDREQWIEQAQILAKGGETYYSRNRAAAARPASAPMPATAQPQTQPPPQTQKAPPAVTSVPPVAQAAPAAAAPAAEPPRPMTPSQAAAAAAAAAAASVVPRTVLSQPVAPAPVVPRADTPASAPAPAAPPAPTPAPTSARVQAVPAAPARPERSVAELAAAAAAAIAAASASVTRGHRPIEPISPLSRVDPNLVMPAKLSDAIKEQGAKASAPAAPRDLSGLRSVRSEALRNDEDGDDLKRIRGIGVLIEKRLNALGVSTYEEIANWTNADIDRMSQQLDFKGRIERENWVEQARILSTGGQTEFSRRVDRGDVESSRDPEAS